MSNPVCFSVTLWSQSAMYSFWKRLDHTHSVTVSSWSITLLNVWAIIKSFCRSLMQKFSVWIFLRYIVNGVSVWPNFRISGVGKQLLFDVAVSPLPEGVADTHSVPVSESVRVVYSIIECMVKYMSLGHYLFYVS